MEGKKIKLSSMRKIISQRMLKSLAQTAQFTLTREIEVDAALLWVQQRKDAGEPVKFMHILVKAVAGILEEFPLLNTSLDEDSLVFHDRVNMGIAVALKEGLVVPVLKNVDKSSLLEIAETYNMLIPKAQEGKLSYADMSEGTFTISNLGMIDIDAFTPIVNYPEAAILGVGRINDRVVLGKENSLECRKTIIFSLTVDHRIIDGSVGADFLAALSDILSDSNRLNKTIRS